MRLVPNSTLYGLPTRAVRDFLRRVAMSTFDDADLRSRLKIEAHQAEAVVLGMIADQLIDHALPVDGVRQYGLTIRGRQLAATKFGAQIPRSVGEQLLAGVVARAADAQTQDYFAFRVTKVALFGSMLGDAPLVSDVDIAVELKSQHEGNDYLECHRWRVEVAEEGGKVFRTRFGSIVWPRVEVIEFVRGGNSRISIHSFTELELLQCPFRIVFEPKVEAREE